MCVSVREVVGVFPCLADALLGLHASGVVLVSGDWCSSQVMCADWCVASFVLIGFAWGWMGWVVAVSLKI